MIYVLEISISAYYNLLACIYTLCTGIIIAIHYIAIHPSIIICIFIVPHSISIFADNEGYFGDQDYDGSGIDDGLSHFQKMEKFMCSENIYNRCVTFVLCYMRIPGRVRFSGLSLFTRVFGGDICTL